MTYTAGQLHEELVTAGLRIRSCGSDGSIDWVDLPTPAEQATAQAVLAAHDPGKRERDRAAEDADRRAKLQQLDAATATPEAWANLSAAQRSEAQRVNIRLTLALARRLLP